MNTTDETTLLAGDDFVQRTPGQIIRTTREAKKISTQEVVQKLLLTKQIIAALEADDYSRVPAQVYAEGYLKAYAQFLEIPPATLLASFRQLHVYNNSERTVKHDTSSSHYSHIAKFIKERSNHYLFYTVFGIIVLGTFLFFVIRLFPGYSTNNNEQSHGQNRSMETAVNDSQAMNQVAEDSKSEET